MDGKDKAGSLHHVGQSQGSRAATAIPTRERVIPEKCTEMECEGENIKNIERWGSGKRNGGKRKEREEMRERKRGPQLGAPRLFHPHYGTSTL